MVAGLTLLAGSQPAAEDAVQEALARAWERSDRGERIETLKAWVTVVATNLLRSRWRRILAEQRARRRLTDLLAAPADSPAGDRLDVFEAVRALPPRQREVVVLRYYLDLTLADVARTVHSSEGAVKNALHHARRTLAARLEAPDPREANDVHGR